MFAYTLSNRAGGGTRPPFCWGLGGEVTPSRPLARCAVFERTSAVLWQHCPRRSPPCPEWVADRTAHRGQPHSDGSPNRATGRLPRNVRGPKEGKRGTPRNQKPGSVCGILMKPSVSSSQPGCADCPSSFLEQNRNAGRDGGPGSAGWDPSGTPVVRSFVSPGSSPVEERGSPGHGLSLVLPTTRPGAPGGRAAGVRAGKGHPVAGVAPLAAFRWAGSARFGRWELVVFNGYRYNDDGDDPFSPPRTWLQGL